MNGYFSFGFVRNPWARLVSWYSMIIEYPPQNPFLFPFWDYVRQNSTCFEDFIRNCTQPVKVHGATEWAPQPQLDYFQDPNGQQLVTFIGRFETLQQDLNEVSKRCNLPVRSVQHHNASSTQKDYRAYYNAETQQIVASRFEQDIERFKYRF